MTTTDTILPDGMIFIGQDEYFDPVKHQYWKAGRQLPSFSWVMRACGLVSDYGSNFAMKRGVNVHRACELFVKGTLDWKSLDTALAGYLEAFQRACEELGFVPDLDACERPMINPVYLFGVKPDMSGWFACQNDPKLQHGVLELKSVNSPSAFTKIVKYQTAAQALTLYPSTYLTARRVTVQLRPDGTYAKEEYEDMDDFDNFLALLKSAMIRLEAGLVKLNEEE